jgi:hypothetical protein
MLVTDIVDSIAHPKEPADSARRELLIDHSYQTRIEIKCLSTISFD